MIPKSKKLEFTEFGVMVENFTIVYGQMQQVYETLAAPIVVRPEPRYIGQFMSQESTNTGRSVFQCNPDISLFGMYHEIGHALLHWYCFYRQQLTGQTTGPIKSAIIEMFLALAGAKYPLPELSLDGGQSYEEFVADGFAKVYAPWGAGAYPNPAPGVAFPRETMRQFFALMGKPQIR